MCMPCILVKDETRKRRRPRSEECQRTHAFSHIRCAHSSMCVTHAHPMHQSTQQRAETITHSNAPHATKGSLIAQLEERTHKLEGKQSKNSHVKRVPGTCTNNPAEKLTKNPVWLTKHHLVRRNKQQARRQCTPEASSPCVERDVKIARKKRNTHTAQQNTIRGSESPTKSQCSVPSGRKVKINVLYSIQY